MLGDFSIVEQNAYIYHNQTQICFSKSWIDNQTKFKITG